MAHMVRYLFEISFEMSAGMMFSCIINLNYDMTVTVRICAFLSLICLFAQTDTHTLIVKMHTYLNNVLCWGDGGLDML